MLALRVVRTMLEYLHNRGRSVWGYTLLVPGVGLNLSQIYDQELTFETKKMGSFRDIERVWCKRGCANVRCSV